MDTTRRGLIGLMTAAVASASLPAAMRAETTPFTTEDVLHRRYRLILELVRHTATYSPPVASRAFAYTGITAYEVLAGPAGMVSLSGQVNGLSSLPQRPGGPIDDATALDAALGLATATFFGNTGPTGQRAMQRMAEKLVAATEASLPAEITARSRAYGEAVATHIIAWSLGDGGAVIENMGFPASYAPSGKPGHWRPTSLIVQQQAPLLPGWGNNRPFAMATGNTCALPPPPAYSEDPSSGFFREAREVYDISKGLTDEQRIIARFWSDDPMLSPTPPGHWISVAMQVLATEEASAARCAAVLARLGITMADAFIGCWHSKFEYDLIRPVSYIRMHIDPKWEPMLITPPFPEYPSGHSTQSGAAAFVLGAVFGETYAFTDATHVDDGLPARHFASFQAAADEAALSRLYGGIHFRAAIERGLEQGRCIGAYAATLQMEQKA